MSTYLLDKVYIHEIGNARPLNNFNQCFEYIRSEEVK